ncbi:unnamed protein product, partial [Effrenium voratum]
DLEERLQGLQRQLSQLQREARRQGKDQQLCGLTSRAQLVCMAVYILSGFHKEPRKKRKRRLGDDILAADVPSQISKWFLELPFERLCQLQLPESEKDKAVHNEAVKYLLGHLGHQLRTSAEGRDGKAGCAGRAARAWCGRFCKQFAFSRKSLRESVQLSADELEEKALSAKSVRTKLDWALAINKAATQFLCSRWRLLLLPRLQMSLQAFCRGTVQCAIMTFCRNIEGAPMRCRRQIALTTRIARLKAVKQEALAKKKATAKSLKAAQKKLKKVKAALTMLSDEDLTHAVTERQAAAKAAAKASASP